MLKTILYATDLGLYGPFLLEHVCELARCHQAQVYVVHAIEPISLFADALLKTFVPDMAKSELEHGGIESVRAAIRVQVKRAFEDDLIDFQEDKEWIADVQVLEGSPAEVILKEAERLHVDLIVLGTHAGNNDRGTAIGSVANKVLQLSRVPVYLVPTHSVRGYSTYGQITL
ncbi:Universal stress protein UspA [gamma proteobacterium HdN1]|nr:Universal stress protein UspA [gamma proteobacterium HdN1]